MRKIIVCAVALLLLASLFAGCMSREDGAKLIAIELAERKSGYEFQRVTVDLDTTEIGLAVDETFYRVRGIIHDESSREHRLVAVVEDLGDEGWRLELLKLDNETLYEG